MGAVPISPPVSNASTLPSASRFWGWPLLAALQLVISLALFHDYIFGDKYFAFMDIGSDTFTQFVPTLIHLADPSNWGSAWSFNVGLGAVLPMSLSPFTLLGIAAGPEHVLDMRIWVYLTKIFAGGAAFYAFMLAIGARREIALLVALSYSFCGYVTTDGQWDPSSSEFAAYAFILWAVARQATHPNSWLIPLSTAFAAYSGAFIFSVGVFVIYAFIAASVASERPLSTVVWWLRSVIPQFLLGLLLAAPVVLPLVFHLLDSPRVSGAQSEFSDRFAETLSINDTKTVLVELVSFFHKNILGVGDLHAGWMNYLESPVFYVGMLPLLFIPQLWLGSRTDRRILIAGGAVLALFIALPAVRYLAFGFGLDYFRVNNLWISILMLVMFARALGSVAGRGVHRWLLGGTTAVLVAGLILAEGLIRPYLSVPHTLKIVGILAVGLLLGLAIGRALSWRQFAVVALGFIAAESVIVSYASFHAQRKPVTRQTVGYSDETLAAVAFLKNRDTNFYRTEKTYHSVSLCDALAQDYMGVKSYWFQSSSTVGFYSDLHLLMQRGQVKNYSNWLPNFGGRFVLNSLVGVKYMITRSPLDWIGFHKIHELGSLSIYENELALPLGMVYERQLLRETMKTLTLEAKDIVMMNAVIVDESRGSVPRLYDHRELTRHSADWLTDNYVTPAKVLQRRGMVVEQFSDGHISGKIASDVPGVLVFSIPHAKGWSVAIDSVNQPVFKAHLGMLATDIASGEHRIELEYALPGFLPGVMLGLLALLGMGTLVVLDRRRLRFNFKSESGP